MPIDGGIHSVMLEDNHVTVTALPAGKCHHSISRRLYSCTGGGSIIYPAVGTPSFQDGMETGAVKSGAYPGKLKRRAQKGLAQILAIGSVISALAILRLKI